VIHGKHTKNLLVRLLKDAALSGNEILILIADYVPAPSHIRYEVNVKKEMNKLFGRLALAGVCRFDSHSNDLLQVVDIIIGAISYDLKLASGVIHAGSKYKRRLLEHLKANLGATNFVSGFRNRNFNIFVDKDMRLRLPLKTNEKGPSS